MAPCPSLSARGRRERLRRRGLNQSLQAGPLKTMECWALSGDASSGGSSTGGLAKSSKRLADGTGRATAAEGQHDGGGAKALGVRTLREDSILLSDPAIIFETRQQDQNASTRNGDF